MNFTPKYRHGRPITIKSGMSKNFIIEINNKPLTNISEDDPLNQGDIGFKKQALLDLTGLQSKLQDSKFVVKAQIHYYSEGKYGKQIVKLFVLYCEINLII
jgi:hypothetical protein